MGFSEWYHAALTESLHFFWLEESEFRGTFPLKNKKKERVHERRKPEKGAQILCINYVQISFWPVNYIYKADSKKLK